MSSRASAIATSAGLRSSSFDFPRRYSLDRLRQGTKDAAQRRIGGQGAEEGLGRDQLGGVAAHLVGGEEEDAVPGEELAAIGLGDGADDVRTTRKVFHQCVRRLIGRFRSRRVDNRYDLVDPLRERPDRA